MASQVKICGLQDVEVLKSIYHLPISYIGFVFAKSRRKVTIDQASEMISLLQSSRSNGELPQTAGVFVNPSKEEITKILQEVPLNIIQLHGNESADYCQWVKQTFDVQVFKSVSIQSDSIDLEEQLNQLQSYVGRIDALLLDTFDPNIEGGTGKAFSWEYIPPFLDWAHANHMKLFVAGGLNPDNISDLVQQYQPDGVDVSSGVETNQMKDINKINAFVERVVQS